MQVLKEVTWYEKKKRFNFSASQKKFKTLSGSLLSESIKQDALVFYNLMYFERDTVKLQLSLLI